MMWYYPSGAGWLGWLLMSFSMIAFWALVIAAIVWAVRASTRGQAPSPPATMKGTTALTILEERFARGEISAEEFAARKKVLDGGG